MKGKSDFKRLVTGSVLWRGAYFLTLFLINVIISSYFTAAGSGWIFYISSYFSFVLLLGSFSLEAGMAYYGARKEVSFQKLTTFGLAWSLLAGMGIVAIAALFYK